MYCFIAIEFQKINEYYKPSQSFDTFKVSVEQNAVALQLSNTEFRMNVVMSKRK